MLADCWGTLTGYQALRPMPFAILLWDAFLFIATFVKALHAKRHSWSQSSTSSPAALHTLQCIIVFSVFLGTETQRQCIINWLRKLGQHTISYSCRSINTLPAIIGPNIVFFILRSWLDGWSKTDFKAATKAVLMAVRWGDWLVGWMVAKTADSMAGMRAS